MGFFSSLKNAVTGGAATVHLQAPAPVPRGEPVAVPVQATASSDSSIDGVYLLVRAVELAEVADTDFDDGDIDRELIRGRRVSYEQRIPVANGQALREGQQYAWEAQLQLPPNVGPTLRGQMIRHEWELKAGLDATGNDPDSGWVAIEVT